MSKSKMQILLWLSGTTKESYYDSDYRKMREGICTTSERLGRAAMDLRKQGFMLIISQGGDPSNLYAYTYWITREEQTESTIKKALYRSIAYQTGGK